MSRDDIKECRVSSRLSLPMVLTGDDVSDHLAAVLQADWRRRQGAATLISCPHQASSRGWVTGSGDLLCPLCCDQRAAELVPRIEAGVQPCRSDGCPAPAAVIAQLPQPRTRRAGSPEVVLIGFWCADCAEPPPDLKDAA